MVELQNDVDHIIDILVDTITRQVALMSLEERVAQLVGPRATPVVGDIWEWEAEIDSVVNVLLNRIAQQLADKTLEEEPVKLLKDNNVDQTYIFRPRFMSEDVDEEQLNEWHQMRENEMRIGSLTSVATLPSAKGMESNAARKESERASEKYNKDQFDNRRRGSQSSETSRGSQPIVRRTESNSSDDKVQPTKAMILHQARPKHPAQKSNVHKMATVSFAPDNSTRLPNRSTFARGNPLNSPWDSTSSRGNTKNESSSISKRQAVSLAAANAALRDGRNAGLDKMLVGSFLANSSTSGQRRK